jgi:hypothetical protein
MFILMITENILDIMLFIYSALINFNSIILLIEKIGAKSNQTIHYIKYHI